MEAKARFADRAKNCPFRASPYDSRRRRCFCEVPEDEHAYEICSTTPDDFAHRRIRLRGTVDGCGTALAAGEGFRRRHAAE
jgi:hypothetical protein